MKHWTENDFKEWLYGLKEADDHTAACPECRAEMERLTLQRRTILAAPEVSEDFLAEQRRNVYRQLHHTRRNWVPLRWGLSVAMALVVVFGLTLAHSRKSAVTLTTDEQLFSDLAAMEQTAEPKAIQPIHKLFEE
jgi:anti-sigma factor RsiW